MEEVELVMAQTPKAVRLCCLPLYRVPLVQTGTVG